MRNVTSGVALFALTAALCSAQSITSARSGTVHYFEGDVSIEGQPLHPRPARFDEVKEQQVLRTGKGRAEILLTPGVFLRVGENSAVRMIDNRLLSTRVEIMSGTVMVESEDPQMSLKDSPVTLVYRDYEVRMVKHGLVEISSDPSEMKVFKGEAEVTAADSRAVIKEGHLMPFTAALLAEKFDPKEADDLYLWARDRSESLSVANMASARTISSGYSDGEAPAWGGGWYYNPYMGMYTYVPGSGMLNSPFGYGFYSPMAIYSVYSPVYSFYGSPARATASTFRGGSTLGASSLSGGGLSGGGFGGASSGLGNSGGFGGGGGMRVGRGR